MKKALVAIAIGVVALPAAIHYWGAVADRWASASAVNEHLSEAEQALSDGRLEEARAAYQHASAIAPADPDIQAQLMKTRIRMLAESPSMIDGGNIATLAYEARFLSKRDKQNAATYEISLGHIHAATGNRKRAREHYGAAIAAAPQQPAPHAAMGGFHLQGGDGPQAARSAFRTAIELDRHHRGARFGLGKLAFDAGAWNEAVEHLQPLVEESDNLDARMMLGLSSEKLGKREEAIMHYRAAVSINDTQPDALKLLGEALLEDRKPAEAEGYLRAAASLRADAKTVTALGFSLAQQNRSREALDIFAKVIREDDGALVAAWGAAQTAEALEQTALASRLYQRVLTAQAQGEDPKLVNKLKKEAQQRLEQLQKDAK